jgi:N-dimethylarginine dimethylaminohydrolase
MSNTPTAVYDAVDQIPSDFLASCRTMALPRRLLMSPPDYYNIIDVKNPHMDGHVGGVNRATARAQWAAVKAALERGGASVDSIDPTPNCEDMVFCANPTFTGKNATGKRICLTGNMMHASRRLEVPALARWFTATGYDVRAMPDGVAFEGGGDAVWHPGRGLIWGGYGHRSAAEAYETVAAAMQAPVLRLKLCSERFYHLDTCLCAIDERTALIHAPSFEPRGVELIRAVFERVVECPDDEAATGMACNATAIKGKHVVIQQDNPVTVAALRDLGYEVHEVDTSEFLKSGGSVYCMKSYVW